MNKYNKVSLEELKELHINLHDGFTSITDNTSLDLDWFNYNAERIINKGLRSVEDFYKYQDLIYEDITNLVIEEDMQILIRTIIFKLPLTN